MVQQIPYPGLSSQNYPYIYDYPTPMANWETDTLNFETPCDVSKFDDTKIWNMNIPWTESPAGLNSSIYEDYTYYGSVPYIGSKEYWNYNNESGGTDTGQVYYYNSFDEKILVKPKEQKAIAIVHYTNQSIDNVYGEKFALLPTDPLNPDDKTGLAAHFKISLPTLLWHKNPGTTFGETFYVEPPNYESLFVEYYLKSTKNLDMNDPGIRYYYLYDLHPDANGNLNRVGRVFPDQQTVVFDDEEIAAALSYKSNRNWTLPAPKLSLITPNACGVATSVGEGLLTGNTQYVYITYRLSNSTTFTNSLHSNYYVKIQGPNNNCADFGSQDVSIRFGGEFGCLKSFTPITTTTTTYHPLTTTTTTHYPLTTTTTTNIPLNCDMIEGFYADKFEVLAQVVDGDGRPEPDDWRIIDLTYLMTNTTYSGYITEDDLVK